MLEMILAGFLSVFSVKTIMLIVAGVILGIVFGAVPGLNTACLLYTSGPLLRQI